MHAGIIYLITCSKNGKKYVGQTITSLPARWSQHIRDKRSNANFANAIRKHGHENFSHEVLIEINMPTKEELVDVLNILEQMYIENYNTFLGTGYNSASRWTECHSFYRKQQEKFRFYKRASAMEQRSKRVLFGRNYITNIKIFNRAQTDGIY